MDKLLRNHYFCGWSVWRCFFISALLLKERRSGLPLREQRWNNRERIKDTTSKGQGGTNGQRIRCKGTTGRLCGYLLGFLGSRRRQKSIRSSATCRLVSFAQTPCISFCIFWFSIALLFLSFALTSFCLGLLLWPRLASPLHCRLQYHVSLEEFANRRALSHSVRP